MYVPNYSAVLPPQLIDWLVIITYVVDQRSEVCARDWLVTIRLIKDSRSIRSKSDC